MRLLHWADEIVKKEKLEQSQIGFALYLTFAWYYTYVEEDAQMVWFYLAKTMEIVELVWEDALDVVDNLIVPGANILLENGELDEAVKWLENGIRMCEERNSISRNRRVIIAS